VGSFSSHRTSGTGTSVAKKALYAANSILRSVSMRLAGRIAPQYQTSLARKSTLAIGQAESVRLAGRSAGDLFKLVNSDFSGIAQLSLDIRSQRIFQRRHSRISKQNFCSLYIGPAENQSTVATCLP
jgi:hypothetical protein